LAVYLGGAVFSALVIGGAGIAGWEWWRICVRPSGNATAKPVLIAAVILATACAAVADPRLALVAIVAGLLLVRVCCSGPSAGWVAFGVAYIGVPGVALIWLRNGAESGQITVFWLLAVVWASDIGAYVAGSRLGGPKLAPRISPNKTWSGALGGLVLSTLVGALFSLIINPAAWLLACAVSCLIGVSAQAGDLVESWIKRRFRVKDASGLIPGHGGLLDRVDALMVASVVAALIVVMGNGRMVIWE
jgi:phosphatidate cytidylyltransferase